MHRVGIWEQGDNILTQLAGWASDAGASLLSGSHPAHLAAEPLALLVVGPEATGWAGANAIVSGAVLLPGTAGPLARGLRAACAISYGTSPKDTLTFSSLEGDQICLAIQRELVTLDGQVVERQELVLPFPVGAAPLPFLAAAGTLLLLGVPPETLKLS